MITLREEEEFKKKVESGCRVEIFYKGKSHTRKMKTENKRIVKDSYYAGNMEGDFVDSLIHWYTNQSKEGIEKIIAWI